MPDLPCEQPLLEAAFADPRAVLRQYLRVGPDHVDLQIEEAAMAHGPERMADLFDALWPLAEEPVLSALANGVHLLVHDASIDLPPGSTHMERMVSLLAVRMYRAGRSRDEALDGLENLAYQVDPDAGAAVFDRLMAVPLAPGDDGRLTPAARRIWERFHDRLVRFDAPSLALALRLAKTPDARLDEAWTFYHGVEGGSPLTRTFFELAHALGDREEAERFVRRLAEGSPDLARLAADIALLSKLSLSVPVRRSFARRILALESTHVGPVSARTAEGIRRAAAELGMKPPTRAIDPDAPPPRPKRAPRKRRSRPAAAFVPPLFDEAETEPGLDPTHEEPT